MTIQSFYDDECVPYPTVYEDDEDKFSGLYDAEGKPLHRKPVKIKMGFDLSPD